jgi:hypothetical protein
MNLPFQLLSIEQTGDASAAMRKGLTVNVDKAKQVSNAATKGEESPSKKK